MNKDKNDRSIIEIFSHDTIPLNPKSEKLLWLGVFIIPVLGSLIAIPIVLIYTFDIDILKLDSDLILAILIFAMGLTFFLMI